jgi:hypothetical protein
MTTATNYIRAVKTTMIGVWRFLYLWHCGMLYAACTNAEILTLSHTLHLDMNDSFGIPISVLDVSYR